MLAYFAHLVSWRKASLYLVIPVIAFLWLIFFPNAPYMLTDLQDLARRSFDAPLWYDVIFVVVISALSSFGIYIGRFVRLNSWDILQNPTEVAQEILGLVIDPSRRLAAFTVLYTIFFLFVFLLLYSFSHMLREQSTLIYESSLLSKS